MKFPLKLVIVHVCRLINTGNIEQNVFFVKTQFLRFCNFFHKKFVKSKLVNFAKMANSKVRDLLQFFINWTPKRLKSIPLTISRKFECLKQVFTRFWQKLMSAEMLIANARLVAPRLCPKETKEVLQRNN